MSSLAEGQGGEIVVRVDSDIADFIPPYLEGRRSDVGTIQSALGRQDFDVIRDLAHKMKGSGGAFGFDDVSVIGGAMEDAAKRKGGEEVRAQVDKLASYLERVKVVYEEAR